MKGKNNSSNIASSWPIIVNEHALNEASILPHLLNEHAQQQAAFEMTGGSIQNRENEEACNDDQLQSMIENYSKHVIKQTQNQKSNKPFMTAERSTSHLQKRITAPRQQTPMSHSHLTLFMDGPKSNEKNVKRVENAVQSPTTDVPFKNNLYKSDSDRAEQITNQQFLFQQKQQIDKLPRKCNRLEQLETAYRKIERDYEQMLCQQEHREELSRIAIQKLELQLRVLDAENQHLHAQIANLGLVPGVNNAVDNGEDSNNDQQPTRFLVNELITKNKELLAIQERQRLELDAQSATLEEQRAHIELLEKALANVQERLAAKERNEKDAAAVRCRIQETAQQYQNLADYMEQKQKFKDYKRKATLMASSENEVINE